MASAGVLAATPEDEDIPIDPTTPIGQAAGLTDESPIEIDNTPKQAAAAGAAAVATKAAKKNPKLKIPNFNKFRVKLLIAGALLILLIVGLWWAFMSAPSAKVTIKGDTNDVPLSVAFIADTAATNVDEEKNIIPGRQLELKKTAVEKVPATGQKDKGTKASGSLTIKNCDTNGKKVTIPAGTGVSANNLTYITQKSVTISNSAYFGGSCLDGIDNTTRSVEVLAQNNGDQYNLGPQAYTVAGFSHVTADGGQMKGGTSSIVKVISQGDVDAAKQKLAEQQAKGRDELKKQLEDDNYFAIIESFSEKDPKYTPSPAVDAEGSEVSVTLDVTYNMLGVRKDDLKKIALHAAGKQVDTTKQAILSDGLDKAAFAIGQKTDKTTSVTMQTTIVAGPEVDKDAIKRDIAGKKRGDAEQLLGAHPGYKEVRIDLSPFWVSKITKKAQKITIIVEQTNGQQLTP
jgi:hypothetical protein